MNQNPVLLARDKIDADLILCGWVIQNKNTINFKAANGFAIREFQTYDELIAYTPKVPTEFYDINRNKASVVFTFKKSTTDILR